MTKLPGSLESMLRGTLEPIDAEYKLRREPERIALNYQSNGYIVDFSRGYVESLVGDILPAVSEFHGVGSRDPTLYLPKDRPEWLYTIFSMHPGPVPQEAMSAWHTISEDFANAEINMVHIETFVEDAGEIGLPILYAFVPQVSIFANSIRGFVMGGTLAVDLGSIILDSYVSAAISAKKAHQANDEPIDFGDHISIGRGMVKQIAAHEATHFLLGGYLKMITTDYDDLNHALFSAYQKILESEFSKPQGRKDRLLDLLGLMDRDYRALTVTQNAIDNEYQLLLGEDPTPLGSDSSRNTQIAQLLEPFMPAIRKYALSLPVSEGLAEFTSNTLLQNDTDVQNYWAAMEGIPSPLAFYADNLKMGIPFAQAVYSAFGPRTESILLANPLENMEEIRTPSLFIERAMS